MGANGKAPQHGKISTYTKHKCRCDECVTFYKAYRKAERIKRADGIREYRAKYYEDNREYFLEKAKERVLTEEQKQANRDRTRKWYQDNRERALAYVSAYNKANPEMRRAIMSRRRQSAATLDEIDRLLSTEYRKAIANDSCFYCGGYSSTMHDDHFFPIAKGGTDHWFNLVRSCQPCNNSKSSKCGTVFALRRSNGNS